MSRNQFSTVSCQCRHLPAPAFTNHTTVHRLIGGITNPVLSLEPGGEAVVEFETDTQELSYQPDARTESHCFFVDSDPFCH